MKAHRLFAATVLVAGAAVGACSSNPPPQSPPGVTNVQTTETQSAAWRLAGARCKHAAACNEVGGNRTYASADACMAQNRGKAEDDLRTADCPRGVDTARLDACLSEIASESCSGIAHEFNRMMSCRTSSLCP